MADQTEENGWELPAGRLTAAIGTVFCPVQDCIKSYNRQAEYKRHVGSAHLSPFKCVYCALDVAMSGGNKRLYYGRKQDMEQHVKDQHKVNTPVQGVHWTYRPATDLKAIADSLKYK